MSIEEIRNRIVGGRCLISFTHAEKLRHRRISIEAIEEASPAGEIVEGYPNDPRGPSYRFMASRVKGSEGKCAESRVAGRGIQGIILVAV
jgi:hypothetical protein